jgi:hypothetical protein
MNPRLKDALIAYVTSTLSDSEGVNEVAMLSLYKLRGESTDVVLRLEVDALIHRVEKRGDRYYLNVTDQLSCV